MAEFMSKNHRTTESVAGASSSELLAAIVNSTDDAIVAKTLEGIVISWNPGAERMFGYTAAEMVGHSLLRLFPADRVQEEHDILAKIARGERVQHLETVRVRKDGQRIEVSVTVSPIVVAGVVVGASKIARDISERKQAERELALATRLYDAFSQLNQAVVRLASREGVIRPGLRCACGSWRLPYGLDRLA